jgi:hypothetical protein
LGLTALDFIGKVTDIDVNNLSKIQAIRLPTDGILKLCGVAIVVG